MENNQSEDFPNAQTENFELSNPANIQSDRKENSTANRTRQTAGSTSKLSPTAREFAPSASAGPTTESSDIQLSGTASIFIPGGGSLLLTNNPISSNDAFHQISYGIHEGRRVVDSAASRSFRNDNRVQSEQTPEYHGVHLKDNDPKDAFQPGILPPLAPLSLSESPPPNSSRSRTNGGGTENAVLPSSADHDWFLQAPTLDKQTTGQPNRSTDDILKALGAPNDLSVPNSSHQIEEYHKQPHAPSLTRILQFATQDRKNRDDRFAALQKREEFFRAQISYLTETIEGLRQRGEQREGQNTRLSTELDDLKLKLSATQDQIKQIEKDHSESDLAKALAQVKKLETEKEHLRRRHDWQKYRADMLQFVEVADLKDRIKLLEEKIKDMRFYPERLMGIHQERIKSFESSLKALTNDRDALQMRLANALRQRDRALEELVHGSKDHAELPACVYDYRKLEKCLKEQIENLEKKVADLRRYELEASTAVAENKELKGKNRVLQFDRIKFMGQISQLQRDRTGARQAFHNLEKREASLKALEEQKVVWRAKEADYIKQQKQSGDEVAKAASEKEELQKQLQELKEQLEAKAWEAEKAKNELRNEMTQQVDNAINQENSRGREVNRDGQAPTTPPMSDSVRSSSEESGAPRSPCSQLSAAASPKDRLEPTGREEYM